MPLRISDRNKMPSYNATVRQPFRSSADFASLAVEGNALFFSTYNILLRSEIPSGMCAKLRTMVASNNRDHARNLSYYCLLALHI